MNDREEHFRLRSRQEGLCRMKGLFGVGQHRRALLTIGAPFGVGSQMFGIP